MGSNGWKTQISLKGKLVVEFEVSYRGNLHDLHNDPPFMCEKRKIYRVQKLVPNLFYKKYVIHIKALDQALRHRLILKRIHRVIEFDQSAWLAPYVDFNTTENEGKE